METNPYVSPVTTSPSGSYARIALRLVAVAIMIPSVIALLIASVFMFQDVSLSSRLADGVFVMLPAIGGMLISLSAWRQQVVLLFVGIAFVMPIILLQLYFETVQNWQ